MKKITYMFMMILVLIFIGACSKPSTDETTIVDSTPPVLTGLTDKTIDVGAYVDWYSGVTATDDVDGDITSSIHVDTSELDIYTPGSYTVTYSVTDNAGNTERDSITVTVGSVDTEAPEITVSGDLSIEKDATDVKYLSGVTAMDNIDGDLTDQITVDSSEVDVTTLGEYTVTYTVTDSSENETTINRTVNVVTITNTIENPSFETGDLTGWTVVSGNAFDNSSVTDVSTFWSHIPFNHEGTYHFRGVENESGTGIMKSTNFKIAGIGMVSFLMGAAKEQEKVYVQIKDANTGEVLAKVANDKFDYEDVYRPFNYAENYARFYVDLSDYIGRIAYIEIVDEDNDPNDFSFINIDDFITYYETNPIVFDELANGDFNTGDLSSWTISGNAFNNDYVLENEDKEYYFDNSTNLELTGEITSETFTLSGLGKISFMISGIGNTYVSVHNASNDEEIARIQSTVFEMEQTYILDLSYYLGEELYIKVVDEDEFGSIYFSHLDVKIIDVNNLENIPSEIINGGFETGDLTGWQIVDGGAFNNNVITDKPYFWEDIDHQTNFDFFGNYHLHGLLNGEDQTGALTSSYFRVGGKGYMSFLLGAAKDPEKVFVNVKDGNTNQVLETITNTHFDFVDFDTPWTYSNNYSRYTVDLSEYLGQVVYIEIIDIDNDDHDFSFINVDDFITYYTEDINIPEEITLNPTNKEINWMNYVAVFGDYDVTLDDSAVNLSEPGYYDLVFTITDNQGTATDYIVTITVTDTLPPTIIGAKDVSIRIGETVDFSEGVSAVDSLGNTLPVTVDSSDVNFDEPGTYTVIYTATGNNGLTTQVDITVTIYQYDYQIENGGFETGDLTGWTIISGDTFRNEVITDINTYWAEQFPYNQNGTYHLVGNFNTPESATGILRSSVFVVAGLGEVSFLMGGANPDHLNKAYVRIVNAETQEVVATVYNNHFGSEFNNNYVRYFVDLSEYMGSLMYIEVVDEDTRENDFAFINVDDFITYYETPHQPRIDYNETIDYPQYTVEPDWTDYISLPNIPSEDVTITYVEDVDITSLGAYTVTYSISFRGETIEKVMTVNIVTPDAQVLNGDFETGDLTGWYSISGTAFSRNVVSSEDTYWDGHLFNQNGEYHLYGISNGVLESEVGVLRSTTFTVDGTGMVSFLMSAANPNHTEKSYVRFVNAATGEVVETVYNTKFDSTNTYQSYEVDLSAHMGEILYIEIVDEDPSPGDFGFINVDNFVTYYEEQ